MANDVEWVDMLSEVASAFRDKLRLTTTARDHIIPVCIPRKRPRADGRACRCECRWQMAGTRLRMAACLQYMEEIAWAYCRFEIGILSVL